jgi:ABC-type bacteriocin/lantibiotic exporter with double-glycine peptidase domain
MSSRGTHAVIVPEVVQTSAMDCGPAALTAALRGFGIDANYGRLREACQTTVDGTSIDTLERVARELGLDARQVVLPADLALHPSARVLPAIVVTVLPGGAPHFVLVWSRVGPWLQVMDPSVGRRWIRHEVFVRDLYAYGATIPLEAWNAWARGEAMVGLTRSRLRELRIGDGDELLDAALDSGRWRAMAELDAAVRMVGAMDDVGAFRSAKARARTLRAVLARVRSDDAVIPEELWMTDRAEDAGAVGVRGALVVSLAAPAADARRVPTDRVRDALASRERSGIGWLVATVCENGVPTLAALATASIVAAAALALEALVLRGLTSVSRSISWGPDRAGVLVVVILLLAFLLALEIPLSAAIQRIGRHLEAKLRVAYLAKLPQIGDRFFHSRLASDMAERVHVLHVVRRMPEVVVKLLRAATGLSITLAALVWIAPAAVTLLGIAAVASVLVPFGVQAALRETDLRMRTHGAALTRFYLDALVGLAPIRAHGAERNVKREHEGLLVEWTRAGRRFQVLCAIVDATVGVLGASFAWVFVSRFIDGARDSSLAMLAAYWALQVPAYGDELAAIVRQLPTLRNVTSRAMELLDAPSDAPPAETRPTPFERPPVITFEGVSVRAGAAQILRDVDLRLSPGEHVAVVGSSGAGKSTLAGLLLGWHEPSAGCVRVDGRELDAETVARVRRSAAWIDPEVRLWNDSLLDNVRYGNRDAAPDEIATAIDRARLRGLLERSSAGLQLPVGEGGARLSGGEGQRLRLARALARRDASIVIMDEPFRGLDRETRGALLAEARDGWRASTVVCVTHDIEETLSFPRVIVVEGGRIVEDAPPRFLEGRPCSRFASLLRAERRLRAETWQGRLFDRYAMVDGRLARMEGAA